MTVYIKNLPYDLDSEELEKIFSQYGEIRSANIINDRDTYSSKGFGFVEFYDASDASKAIDALNGTYVRGRKLRVEPAREREHPTCDRGEGT